MFWPLHFKPHELDKGNQLRNNSSDQYVPTVWWWRDLNMMITHKSVVTQGRIQDFHTEGAHRTSRAPQSSAKSEPAGVRGARLMPPGHSRDLYGFSQGRRGGARIFT